MARPQHRYLRVGFSSHGHCVPRRRQDRFVFFRLAIPPGQPRRPVMSRRYAGIICAEAKRGSPKPADADGPQPTGGAGREPDRAQAVASRCGQIMIDRHTRPGRGDRRSVHYGPPGHDQGAARAHWEHRVEVDTPDAAGDREQRRIPRRLTARTPDRLPNASGTPVGRFRPSPVASVSSPSRHS